MNTPTGQQNVIATAGWEDILRDGEEILWQGRPNTKLSLLPVRPMQVVMGIFFTVFAIFWVSMAISMTWSSNAPWFFRYVFPLFGMIFVFVGLHMAGGYAFTRAYRARHTWYTLTNRHAFVATNLPLKGKRLKSYPITVKTALDYDGGHPGTIYFAHDVRRGRNGTYRVPVGFERIEEASEVYRLMRDIQSGDET
ncbi:aspartate carbamoyltransferase catalytic subunit [Alisedimentitalea sp. MJ-SS2]|uniref:aspartate carbamoyltransferase catalytic subunit n=1 Tax=Aliisedimentitalea sp. MJ-SS2 TaxID=3049795 RepID=UPI002910C479|nr:aspartate carbamoyltransferase catalytic subunit [Alisedimentitalea sp. MJ-SS2]MDU8928489.1 aspartate carbamoyltransferase catalytic subunit [Alisedimentitalea sp. MJ-SS2]